MSTITDLFQQAQLAESAYANFIDPQTGLVYTDTSKIISALQNQNNDLHFSTVQATDFANRYQVVSQLQNTNSGFSATVFLDNTTGTKGTGVDFFLMN